jgi:hypothetical protein
VVALDAAGNRSPAAAVDGSAQPDATPPAAPTGLSAVAGPSQGEVTLAWTAALDDVAVTGYEISRDGAVVATLGPVTTYTDSGLAPGSTHHYAVVALDAAGNRSPAAAVELTLPLTDPVIAAAGDIACDPANPNVDGSHPNSCQQVAVSDLLVGGGLAAVLPLGDNQYFCGSLQAYRGSYDLSWGRLRAITRPAPGNHEYLTHGGTGPDTGCNSSNAGAAGYFGYFGAAAGDPSRGYYSYDVGSWHLIALNSQCGQVGGCGPGSEQGRWLADDLASHGNSCTLAYWHIPLFSSGGRDSASVRGFWTLLATGGADVVLNGHDHTYERFAPQTPAGDPDPQGIREFVVGTGGANHTSFGSIVPNSEVRNDRTYGVLRLTLHPAGYDWEFAPVPGASFTDSGSGSCH